METQKLTLHAVMVEDPDGGYSGYFKEFPKAYAEGETKDELLTNLFKSVAVFEKVNRQKKQVVYIDESEEMEVELAYAS